MLDGDTILLGVLSLWGLMASFAAAYNLETAKRLKKILEEFLIAERNSRVGESEK